MEGSTMLVTDWPIAQKISPRPRCTVCAREMERHSTVFCSVDCELWDRADSLHKKMRVVGEHYKAAREEAYRQYGSISRSMKKHRRIAKTH